MLFKKFCAELITGLLKDIAGLLNWSSFNTLRFLLIRPSSGSSYIKLPVELKSPKKGLINIKNKDQKCLLWCHGRHINPVKIHPERITQNKRIIVNSLNYDGVSCERKTF